MARKQNRYSAIVETIFVSHRKAGQRRIEFRREEMISVAEQLGITLPKNLGDVLYSFRFRTALPASISATAPAGQQWVIRLIGQGLYEFALMREIDVSPSPLLAKTKIPDATPGIVSRYSLTDEQALLAKLRYNRLVDIFTGLTCYSLQNHLRTSVPDIGQVETDEAYIGVDRRGVHYVLTVQAKGGTDKIGIVQIEQDFAVCAAKFPDLEAIPLAAHFTGGDVIALFAFESTAEGIKVTAEKHYQLVPSEELSPEELASYRSRPG